MRILQVGESVFLLRFLPDGRHLLAGVVSAERVVTFDVWTLSDGGRVRLSLPQLTIDSWVNSGHGNAVAVHPSGEWVYLAWGGGLYSFRTADGTPRPMPEGVMANQVAIAPGGDRVLAAHIISDRYWLSALAVDGSGDTLLRHINGAFFCQLAGFLPDGERFVTIGDQVRVRRFTDDEVEAVTSYPTYHANHAQVSPDGRHVAVTGYGSMYVFDLAALGKPRRIKGSSNFGNFISFAFHPGGSRLAVIHGGLTLVKLYDVATLKLVHKFNWKVGALGCVAFSPDGMLGAAGSQDGRIVVWDVDE